MAGAAVGAWAATRTPRHPHHVDSGQTGAVIDWEHARGIAVNMNRSETLTSSERARLDALYRALVDRCVPIVATYTKSELPRPFTQVFAFDRVDWVNANLDAFRVMFQPLELLNESAQGVRSVAASLWGGLNRTVVSAEIGLLLGYLARRVLGQYDLALLGREPVTGGKLYYVEPNIRMIERNLELPQEEFRMWLALHETTHAFEFEAHPWVRTYFNGLLEEYFEFLKQDVDQLRHGMRGLKLIVGRVRTRDKDDAGWIEALMAPEQRVLFNKMQALMCVVEGYSNHVMNAVGKELLPSFNSISSAFERRQKERGAAEQLFARLTGLDIKMEQYRLGQAFIDRVAEQHGHDAARRVWDGPQYLPTMEELRTPDQWIMRIAKLEIAVPLPSTP